MIYIAHRGNIDGSKPELENSPAYINSAIDRGFFVEVDIWVHDGRIWSGHDTSQWGLNYPTLLDWRHRAYFHCKNTEALDFFSENRSLFTFFWHQEDQYTLTSNGYVWVYPNRTPTYNSIIVMPEKWMDVDILDQYQQKYDLYGVCSDVVASLRV